MLVFQVISILFCALVHNASSYSTPPPPMNAKKQLSRSSFFQKSANAAAASILGITGASFTTPVLPSMADEEIAPKQKNLSDDELKKILTSDIVDRSFLASADITRSIYDESAIFTDEIDSYTIDKWIKGTKKLFVAEQSNVELLGEVMVTPEKAEFRFYEDLMFRIPFRPVMSITGTLVLKRDKETGLINDYKEYWDGGVSTVLKTTKFNI